MTKRILFPVLMLAATFSVFSENSRTILSETFTIFGETGVPPVILDSSRDWTTIAVIDWDRIEYSATGRKTARIWRLRSRYEHQVSGGPATIQVRIRNQTGTSVFTHSWAQSADRSAETYSNWLEDTKRRVDSGERSIVEAKLIAPPRTPLQGTLYAVSMEAWDVVPNKIQPSQGSPPVQLAYTQPPIAQPRTPHTQPPPLDFALKFVDFCITGDLAAYYRFQSDTVHSLDDGSPQQKYRLPPPAGIPGISTIQDYKDRFDYKLYDMETYGAMFPEWFDVSREWIPGTDTYLFMGHKDNRKQANFGEVDFLVFLIGMDQSGAWKVVARPES